MPLCAEIHGSLASQDASAGVQAARPYLLAQARHGVDQVERGPDRAFRVVLVGNGCSPHRHHGIADELLDLAREPPRLTDVVEASRLELVQEPESLLRERKRTGSEGSMPRDLSRAREQRGPAGGLTHGEGRPAFAAERVVGLDRGAAGGTGERERAPALPAEPLASLVLGGTARAAHDASEVRSTPRPKGTAAALVG